MAARAGFESATLCMQGIELALSHHAPIHNGWGDKIKWSQLFDELCSTVEKGNERLESGWKGGHRELSCNNKM